MSESATPGGNPWTLVATTADDMRALGTRLGALLDAGDVVALVGALGAGKTTFAQGLAAGLGVPESRHVASPTFALVNEHPGRVPFVHADLYRIENPNELDELGLDEAFDRAVVAIEWPDRFAHALPADRLQVTIARQANATRTLVFDPRGDRAARVVATLRGAKRF